MAKLNIRRGGSVLIAVMMLVFSVLAAFRNVPAAHAAVSFQLTWVNATTVRVGGSAVQAPVNIQGQFTGITVGGGTQVVQGFRADGVVDTSFGCKLNIYFQLVPGGNGQIDFSNTSQIGAIVGSSPSTCTLQQVQSNINGVVRDPNGGNVNYVVQGNTQIANVGARGTGGGGARGSVDVTAGMGTASNFTGLPATDTFILCESRGQYITNKDLLDRDCLARKNGTVTQTLTTGGLATLKNGQGPNGGDEKAWQGVFNNVPDANYVVCSTNFNACQFFNASAPATVVRVFYGQAPGSTIPGTPPGSTTGQDEKVCTTGDGLAGGLAWVLCPFAQIIVNASEYIQDHIIIPFLTVSPLTTNSGDPVYNLWQAGRNFTNIVFVIFFFIIIFSQATSIGISNYGIKRLLPRMVAVVIASNLSYFLAAFAIDAFNIFGGGVSQLVTTVLNQSTAYGNGGTSASTVRSIFTIVPIGLAAVLFTPALGWLISFLGFGFLFILIAVVTLVIRQMVIVVLVILSSLAILCYLLPNTEEYFTKWRKMLLKLLMMYPLIVLLFAAGQIFGAILQNPNFNFGSIIINYLPFHTTYFAQVHDLVSEGVRVGMQFLAKTSPLALLPGAYFLVSPAGARIKSLYSRGKKPVSNLGSKFHENFVKPRQNEAQMLLAKNTRGGKAGQAVSWVAGRRPRRELRRSSRQAETELAEKAYLANYTRTHPRYAKSAAGPVGGAAGQARVLGRAEAEIAKLETQELEDAMSTLTRTLKDLNIADKTFTNGLQQYLSTGKDEVRDSQGNVAYKFSEHPGLMKAGLNLAAQTGEVNAIRAARLSDTVDQRMVDDVIRRNDGSMKGKGGYDLAINFDIARGRMVRTNSKGKPIDAAGNVITDPTTQAAVPITNAGEMKIEMEKQQLITIANTGANSIAGMKASVLGHASELISPIDPADPEFAEKQALQTAVLASLDTSTRDAIRQRMTEIYRNKTTLNSSEAPDAIESIMNNI